MASIRAEVQKALRQTGGLRLSAGQIAKRLYCSESTLRRHLRAEGTSFVKERKAARAEAAFELLKRRYPVEQAARRVGLSPDHLRLVMEEVYRFSPAAIKQMVVIAERLKQEPESRRQLELARRDDELLQGLLGHLDASHPLYEWAKDLVLLGHHPERESAKYREQLKQKERLAYIRQTQRQDAEAVTALSVEDLYEVDVESLLSEREHRQEHMRWRANQLRRYRRANGATR
jgi:AraC-like DNA-binding protein